MIGRSTCDREPEVLEGIRSGHTPDAVRSHLAGCARCRAAAGAASWMRRMADTTGEHRALPDPALLWWRAQLVRRWQAERRASAPLDAMHHAELWVGVLSLLGLVLWQGPALLRWAVSTPAVDPVSLTRWTTAVDPSMLLTVIPIAFALLGLAALVTVTRFIIVE
jgi:hypothetical protein